MKKTLTIFGLLLTTLLFGQTTQMEMNYANGGYIELAKMGMDQMEGYEIRETGILFPPARGLLSMSKKNFYVLKLVRTKDESIAAIMIAEKGEKPVMTVMDPKTDRDWFGENNYEATERGPQGIYFDYQTSLAWMIMRQFWPEYYEQ